MWKNQEVKSMMERPTWSQSFAVDEKKAVQSCSRVHTFMWNFRSRLGERAVLSFESFLNGKAVEGWGKKYFLD